MANENAKENSVPRKVNSEPCYEESMLKNWKRSMVIQKPTIDPVAKIVYSKNLRPMKATIRPKAIAMTPRIAGLLTKYRVNFVTEMREQALT
jgi:hypothetical protein